MPRFKDLPKTHLHAGDGYIKVDEYNKGSVGGSIIIEPAIMERRIEPTYADLLIDLQEIKRDIQKLKEMVETMDRNGLKMKPHW